MTYTQSHTTADNCNEAIQMARVLERLHGARAAEVAEFFATAHELLNDSVRQDSWCDVANTVRQRQTERVHAVLTP